MEIEFCNNNKVTISMFKYIHEAIKNGVRWSEKSDFNSS